MTISFYLIVGHNFIPDVVFNYRKFAGAKQDQGRSSTQLKYVEDAPDDVGWILWERFVKMCNSVPAQNNFYLSWSLRGSRGFDPTTKPEMAPPYLRKEGFLALKVWFFLSIFFLQQNNALFSNYIVQKLVDRVFVCTGSLHDVLLSMRSKRFTKVNELPVKSNILIICPSILQINLSNIFEYLSEQASHSLFELIGTTIVPGAVIAYFELFLLRTPAADNTKLKHLKELSERLSSKGRVHWFRTLRLYEVQ